MFSYLFFKSLFSLIVLLLMGYFGASMVANSVAVVAALYFLEFSWIALLIIGFLLVVVNISELRSKIISMNVMKLLKALKLMPQISETEKIALEAGNTWVDGELFSGCPDFSKILKQPYKALSQKEKEFVDNQCETLCQMMDDTKAYEEGDLSVAVWEYLKKEKFFGIVIPVEYGGLGFSARCHSEIIHKLSSCSIPLVISVMVPNSLGPGELLAHYGTKEQKDYYLPRLAVGKEIPCFGLTEPTAGSDAGSITSTAVIFKGEDEKLYLKINWNKRWITLGSASTLLGLAVKLLDPDHLIGDKQDIGITCVLVPSKTKGVTQGYRHDPLGVPFINSPLEGKDVVVSIDQIIGGLEGAGKGWKMLMECLAAGRSISLPSQSGGNCKFVARVVGSYAQVRRQFGQPIGAFEGVEEVVARIGAFNYIIDAARIFTVGAVDMGLKPAVVSAIVKYHSTEMGRQAVIDGMDVFGGAGITLGKKNILAKAYIAAPIAITVEGANILTRTMIIFGQGAIRCHPFAYKEVVAIEKNDISAFDEAFFGHIGHVLKNTCRAVVLSFTRGFLAKTPKGIVAPYYRKLSWCSASFALLADVAMGALGGKLKIKEKLAGRYADILSWMYLITAVLRRFDADGYKKEHEPFLHYCCQFGFHRIQNGFLGILSNFEVPVLGFVLRYLIAPWVRFNSFGQAPSDALNKKIAKIYMVPGALRDEMTYNIYLPKAEDSDSQVARLEKALCLSYDASLVEKKIKKAVRSKKIKKAKGLKLYESALDKNVITQEEFSVIEKAHSARIEAIQVDSYAVGDLNINKSVV